MKPNLQSQKGQLIVEAVLLMVVMLGVTIATAKYFKSEELLKKLVAGPWQSLAGMLQNGVWGTPEATNSVHPSAHGRHLALEGERVQ